MNEILLSDFEIKMQQSNEASVIDYDALSYDELIALSKRKTNLEFPPMASFKELVINKR